jgi:hypothetical protein
LIKQAWDLRLQGKTLEETADFLNGQNYQRAYGIGKITNKTRIMSKKDMSELFKDTFYTGVMKYGKNVVNLWEVYDFTPMVSVEDFLKITKLSDITKAFKANISGKRIGSVKADFLRGKVICGYCGSPLSSGITSKKTKIEGKKYYYYYRCDNPDCFIKNKSGKKIKHHIRAKVILDFVYQFLDEHNFTSQQSYDHYLKEMASVKKRREQELDSLKRSLLQKRHLTAEKIDKIKAMLLDEEDEEIRRHFKIDLKTKDKELKELEDKINKVKQALKANQTAVFKYSEFVELLRQLPDFLRKTKDMRGKDEIISKIFSNWTIKDKKVAEYQLNQPFKSFVEKGFVTCGRGGRNRTDDLTVPNRTFYRLNYAPDKLLFRFFWCSIYKQLRTIFKKVGSPR